MSSKKKTIQTNVKIVQVTTTPFQLLKEKLSHKHNDSLISNNHVNKHHDYYANGLFLQAPDPSTIPIPKFDDDD